MYRSILVPLDGSPLSEQALPLAISIARRAGAALQLAQVQIDRPLVADAEDALEQQDQRAYLDAWVERLRAVGCRAASALLDAPSAHQDATEALSHAQLIAAALHDQALAMDVDLVVMTTHARSGVARMWLGSVATALVRRLPMPILLVRPQPTPPDLLHEQVFKHVLVPLDGSPRAETVLDHAIALCALFGARCTLLQAMDPLLARHTIPPYTVGLTTQEAEQMQAECRAYLARTAERLRAQVPQVQTHFVIADPATAITTYAHEHAVDMIAMATHGRRVLSRIVLGSVADTVVRHTDAAVLLYRPPANLWLAGHP